MDEIAIHEKHDSDESFEEDNADYIEGDDFLFDLSCLSKKDLKSLKKLYPNLPEYYFKSQPEKKKYFQQLNKKYYEKLSKEKPKTPSSIPKKVDFNVKLNQIKGYLL